VSRELTSSSAIRSEVQWANCVAWEVQEAGFSCSLQAWHFAPGEGCIHNMQHGLSDARHTVAILSDDHFNQQPTAELNAALASELLESKRNSFGTRETLHAGRIDKVAHLYRSRRETAR
jgi:hypothetical protein